MKVPLYFMFASFLNTYLVPFSETMLQCNNVDNQALYA